MDNIILIILIPLKFLPPAISLINTLTDIGCNLKVIVSNGSSEYRKQFDSKIKWYDIFDYDLYKKIPASNIFKRFYINRIATNKKLSHILHNTYKENDIIWFVHEESAQYISKNFTKYRFFISIYELKKNYKIFRFFKSNIPYFLKNAEKVIVPEINRSHIMKSWFNLSKLPTVLPNKPYPINITRHNNISNEIARSVINSIKDKKIILYQGSVGYDRNIDPFIEAINQLSEEFIFVLMCTENSYVKDLVKNNSNHLIHINSIPAPYHLEVTSWAYIGVLSYVPNVNIKMHEPLNAIFSAPNKIYEYSAFSIPMIGNLNPGLLNTIGKYDAGLCVNIDNTYEVVNGILQIEKNYEKYSSNSNKLFEGTDILNIIETLVKGETDSK